MGIVEEISTIWPGAVFGHIPTSGKLAEIRCNCMPLISQYQCYTHGALSGMCRPEEHSSSHPQQKMQNKGLEKKCMDYHEYTKVLGSGDEMYILHKHDSSGACIDLSQQTLQKALPHNSSKHRKLLTSCREKKTQGSLPCTSIKGYIGGNPVFVEHRPTRKFRFFFGSFPPSRS